MRTRRCCHVFITHQKIRTKFAARGDIRMIVVIKQEDTVAESR